MPYVRRPHPGSRGFTLVELMVALVAASILIVLALASTAQVNSTSQSQRDVADVIQSLRAASDLIAADVRNAGYDSASVSVHTSGGTTVLRGLSVLDAADKTPTSTTTNVADEISLFGADSSVEAHVSVPNTGFTSASTKTDSVAGFVPGMLAIAVNPGPCPPSTGAIGCVLYVDGANSASGHINHNPGLGAPWNQPGNTQCNTLNGCWSNGKTVFELFVSKSYRIAPPADYPQGMLQRSPSGGLNANDWENLGMGFVDLQVALCLDANSDSICEPTEWVNNAGMVNPPAKITAVRITLVARTFSPAAGWNAGQEPSAEDHAVPSMLGTANAGYIYRSFTQTIDLRNGPL